MSCSSRQQGKHAAARELLVPYTALQRCATWLRPGGRLAFCDHEETSAYAGRFYTRILTGYVKQRAAFEASRGLQRSQERRGRLQMTQRFATLGCVGQIACIAEKPHGAASRVLV